MTVLIVAVVGGIGGVGFYFYNQYQHARNLLKDPAAAAQEEINSLKNKVSQHIQLPEEEIPTVATVSDKSKLEGQPFFANAQSGDKVLIFTKAGKAILFRPEIDRIIEVAPVNLEPEVAGTQSAKVQEQVQLQEATLTILNSTNTAGLASVAEKAIIAQSEAYKILTKANAKNDNYEKTVVVVLKPEANELARKLAEIVGVRMTTSSLGGEDNPETDLLLILGTDYKP